ncbi:MAG: hypothetical protein ABIJ56_14555 [Pseudomonadota bacterium]
MNNEKNRLIICMLAALAAAAGFQACNGDNGDEQDTQEEQVLDVGDAGDQTGDPAGEIEEDAEPDAGDVTDEEPEGPEVNGRLERVDGVDVLYVWGTRREMGYAEGALLCGRITKMLQNYILDTAVPESGLTYDTLLAGIAVFHAFPEGDEEHMKGIMYGMQDHCAPEDLIVESEYLEASAGGRREAVYEDIRVAHALPDYLCSSLTVWGEASKSGKTLHARNLDFYTDPFDEFISGQMIKVYDSDDDGGARYMSVSIPGLVGCISCFGEDGAGITIHNADGYPDASEYGNVPRVLAARQAMVAMSGAADPAAAAEEAIELLPQRMGDIFHLSFPCDGADCDGGAILELDGDSTQDDGMVTVRAPGEDGGDLATMDGVITTNHFLKRMDPSDIDPESSTAIRYGLVKEGVNFAVGFGGLDVEGAVEIMESVTQLKVDGATVHTVIMDTDAMELHLYIAPDGDHVATDAAAVVFDFEDLFSGLP